MYIEIVKFKLKSDVFKIDFLELTKQMVAWLKQREGFVSYELYKGTEFWVDRICWETEKYALKGQKDFLKTSIAQDIIECVDSGYDIFLGEMVISS